MNKPIQMNRSLGKENIKCLKVVAIDNVSEWVCVGFHACACVKQFDLEVEIIDMS